MTTTDADGTPDATRRRRREAVVGMVLLAIALVGAVLVTYASGQPTAANECAAQATIPEPETLLFFALAGVAALGGGLRRRDGR